MNISNKLCRYTVTTVWGMCFLVIISMFGLIGKHVEAVENQTPEAVINKESVQSTTNANVNLLLVGTVLSDAGKSVAIFEDNKTNAQQFHRLGDTIEGGRIMKILKDRVFLTKDDVEVELKIGYGTGSTFGYEGGSGSYQAKQETLRDTLERLSRAPELIPQPEQPDDEGFHVGEFSGNDLLGKLGLQTGDIIRDINGLVPGAGLSLKEAVTQVLKDDDELLQIGVEREGYMEVIQHQIQH